MADSSSLPALPARKLRLLVVSTYPVADSTAGSLLLFRHLQRAAAWCEYTGAHLVVPPQGHNRAARLHAGRWLERLKRFGRRAERIANALDALSGFSLRYSQFQRAARTDRPDVILTVAEGAITIRAWQLAREFHVPLIVVLHDWYPGGLDVPERLRTMVVQRFRRICRESAATLSVCEEMREASGGGTNARVLHPIPDPSPTAAVAGVSDGAVGFHALFAGRFDHFLQDEMLALARELAASGQADLLRVIGPAEGWHDETRRLMHSTGVYRGFHKGEALHAALREAAVLLVFSPFASASRHIARYSFASKLPEYCHHARPIVIWGPADAASVRWAKRTGAALAVTDAAPRALVDCLAGLRAAPAQQAALSHAAAEQARTTFDPESLQQIFADAVRGAHDRSRATSRFSPARRTSP